MDDEASKLMQFNLSIEKEKKKVGVLTNKRYQKLIYIEDKSDQVHQLLQEKSRLVKKRREMHEAMKAMQARIEKIESQDDVKVVNHKVHVQMEKT